jgi:hypothetical protein
VRNILAVLLAAPDMSGVQVRKSVRRIKVAMASACPTRPRIASPISICAAPPPSERSGIRASPPYWRSPHA